MGKSKRKDSLRLKGDEVVFAVAVSKDRLYRTWIRGPTTKHSNADMLRLMGITAVSLVIEIAKFEKIPVQTCIDEAVKLFKESLEGSVHKALAGEYDLGESVTVGLDVEGEGVEA